MSETHNGEQIYEDKTLHVSVRDGEAFRRLDFGEGQYELGLAVAEACKEAGIQTGIGWNVSQYTLSALWPGRK